jgi:allophanate hydrolase subunit 1
MKYQRPSTATVAVERTAVAGNCSACGAAQLASYPVLSEGGWFKVVKCQACLNSVSREADVVGPIELLSRSI